MVTSSAMLYIGNKRYSSWSLRPWLVAQKAGIPFIEKFVPVGTIESKVLLKKTSPSGKVPLWVDGDLAIWDSLAICEYLAERIPTLWPVDAQARAIARAISAEMHSGFQSLRTDLTMNAIANRREIDISSAVQGDLARIDVIWQDVKQRFGQHGQWLFGEFSIADAMYAPVVLRLNAYNVSLSKTMQDYVNTWLADETLQAWISAAKQETIILDQFEMGQIVNHES